MHYALDNRAMYLFSATPSPIVLPQQVHKNPNQLFRALLWVHTKLLFCPGIYAGG